MIRRAKRSTRPVHWFADVAMVACIACVAGVGCSRPAGPASQPPERIIWITLDSLRPDHLGMHGYERDTSPWLDEFARRSVNFEWALSPSNETLLSVAAYFAGRPSSAMQRTPLVIEVPREVETLAERLQAEGFRTTAISANPMIRPEFGYDQGFDEFELLSSPGNALASLDEIVDEVRRGYSPSGGREFIYVHTMDVHHPYRPRLPFGAMFTGPYRGRHVRQGSLVENDRITLARSTHPYWSEAHDVQPEDIERLTALYDGAIRYTDAALPRLLDALKFDAARDLLVITSDHGEQLLEMGWWTHFATLTPIEIRVPLVVRYDGFPARSIGEPVGLVDLYPTILDLYGLSPRSPQSGVSLLPVLRGKALPGHEVYAESAPRHGLSAALVDARYWYWMSGNRSTIAPWHAWPYAEYLFDYRSDPGSLQNLASSEPNAAASMNGTLRRLYPRWEHFTHERLQGDDDRVEFGPDLIEGARVLLSPPEAIKQYGDGRWRADVSTSAIRYEVEGLTPYEPLYLRFPYSLESGSIRITFAPAEYSLPSLARIRQAWTHDFLKPTDETVDFGTIVVPTADTAAIEIALEAETRAWFSAPNLHRPLFDPIEPWLRLLDAGADVMPGIAPEEYERLQAIGYVSD
jgi:arylsulfatase